MVSRSASEYQSASPLAVAPDVSPNAIHLLTTHLIIHPQLNDLMRQPGQPKIKDPRQKNSGKRYKCGDRAQHKDRVFVHRRREMNPKHWIERCKAWGILKQDPTHTGLRPEKPIRDALEQKGFEVIENFKPVSMIPVFNWFEKVWSLLPVVGELGIYRIAVLARKK